MNDDPSLQAQSQANQRASNAIQKPLLVIGGAGFIGANLADLALCRGEDVIVFDNLSRPGVEGNLAWLKMRHSDRLKVVASDVRDVDAVVAAVGQARAVFHFAAQVAVTSSLDDPLHDFTVNAQGTLTVLEAIRRHAPSTPLIFASTNKVYGTLTDLAVELRDGRYAPVDAHLRGSGIDELRPLNFCTPYGCSKGAADQYVLDYARSFDLRTAVLRMSCIYGPRQFGTEDQGWVAHFLVRVLRGEPIMIYGDGKQVRDILHVNDAVAAYFAVLDRIDSVAGQAFNLGGGISNAVSLQTALQEIAIVTGSTATVSHADWRSGDQCYFVANCAKLSAAVGWRASIGWRDGLRDLAESVRSELGLPPTVVTSLEQRLRA